MGRGGTFAMGLAFVAVALLVAFATAVAFFPYQALEERLESVVRERSGAKLNIADTGFRFPLGLGAGKAEVRQGSRVPALELRDIELRWRPWGLLFGEQRFSGQASICGGRIRVDLRFDSLSLSDSGAGSLEMEDISLGECGKSLPLDLVSGVSGRLGGKVLLRHLKGDVLEMSGNASVEVENGELGFKQGPLRGLAIREARLVCRLHKKGDTLRVQQARLDSPGMEGSLSGEIRLKRQLDRSDLDLRTELGFHPGRLAGKPENAMVRQALAQKGMELLLSGTVSSPRIQMQ